MREALQTGRAAGHRRDFARPPLVDSADSGADRELDYPMEYIQQVKARGETCRGVRQIAASLFTVLIVFFLPESSSYRLCQTCFLSLSSSSERD